MTFQMSYTKVVNTIFNIILLDTADQTTPIQSIDCDSNPCTLNFTKMGAQIDVIIRIQYNGAYDHEPTQIES